MPESLTGLAVVLARGGSKRIPGKNLKILHGKPLIGWVLETAHQSGCFQKVLVSTDCPEIAKISAEYKGWVPFLRPPELASDTASSLDALVHAVEWASRSPELTPPEFICLIQPTSPFLSPTHLREAVKLFRGGGFQTLGSLCPVRERPEYMFTLDQKNGRAVPLQPEKLALSSKELPALYKENGAFYLMKTDFFLRRKSMYDLAAHGAYIMPPEASIDIDTPQDWLLAEIAMNQRD